MTETYHRVYDTIWLEPWTEKQTHLALYLLTCRHRTFEGIYYLPLPYVASDLKWTVKQVTCNLAALEADGFAKYDRKAEVMWVVKALKRQTPNDNQVRAAARKIHALPATDLLDGFLTVSRNLCPKLADAVETLAAEKAAA